MASLDENGRYVIKGGDYLNLIASCTGVTLEAIRAANPDSQVLIPGATLVIPTTSLG